eukprot:3623818-Pyramimonas_sp.AAC.1
MPLITAFKNSTLPSKTKFSSPGSGVRPLPEGGGRLFDRVRVRFTFRHLDSHLDTFVTFGHFSRVLAYDPFPKAEAAASIGFEYAPLDTLLAESDVISLHCPLVAQTKHLINAATIGKMKRGCVLINTSRGGLVKTDELIEALETFQVIKRG